jgi:uncharacterized protein
MTWSSLTIVGGSARAAAQSAVRAGFSPIAGDQFGDEDLRQLCPTTRVDDYPAGLMRVCTQPHAGPWMYTGALENHPQLIARMSELRPLLGNNADVVCRVRDPFALAAALVRAGFASLSLSRTAEGLPRDGSWLRKPYRSAGGAEITRWDAANSSDPTSARFYFQKFAAGEVCGAVYVANGADARLLGVSRQLPSVAGSFLYHGSIGPIALPEKVRQQCERLGQFLATELKLVGLFGVDVVLDDEMIWPLEVNPRYTASVEVLERALGLKAIQWHVAGCRKERLSLVNIPTKTQVAAKRVLYAPCQLSVPDALLATVVQENTDNSWPNYADLPAAGAMIRAGWPILTVLAVGDRETSVLQSLHRQAATVEKLLAKP